MNDPIGATGEAMPDREKTLNDICAKARNEWEERELKERDRFETLFSNWLKVRSAYSQPDVLREIEIARAITTMPAVYPWMIFHKLEVLEHYLCNSDDGTSWTDNREVVMLAGIKADLLRFSIKREGD